MWHPTGR